MQVKVITKEPINRIACMDLNGHSVEQSTDLDLNGNWYKLIIPTHRSNITDITIAGESIKHILNSGAQVEEYYHIWLHGNLDQLMERVFSCIAQDDLLRWTKLNRKYLLTESWNHTAPNFVPNHVKNFFARGEGPYWWAYSNHDQLPYRVLPSVEYNPELLLASINEDLTYVDTKFYGGAHCKSLKPKPTLPLTPVDQLKNNVLKKFLKSVGFNSVLQIQYVEMSPQSYIDIHQDDFTYESGLPHIKGASQLYCVLRGQPDKFKMRFARAGMIDVTKPIFINNNAFVHSLYYNGDDTRATLLVYGSS
jgi:hypothetical protein